jgi:hypothetical protein
VKARQKRRPPQNARPPAGIGSGPTLQYVIVPRSLPFVNRGRFIVGGKTFGRAPRLTIGQDRIQKNWNLLFWDARWRLLAGTSASSIAEAKAEAERFYPGLSPHWVDLRVSEAAAAQYMKRLRAETGCSFCGKVSGEYRSSHLFEVDAARICGDCVKAFHGGLPQGERSRSSGKGG